MLTQRKSAEDWILHRRTEDGNIRFIYVSIRLEECLEIENRGGAGEGLQYDVGYGCLLI